MYLGTSSLYILKGHKSEELKRRAIYLYKWWAKRNAKLRLKSEIVEWTFKEVRLKKRKRDKCNHTMITHSSFYGPNWAHIFTYSIQVRNITTTVTLGHKTIYVYNTLLHTLIYADASTLNIDRYLCGYKGMQEEWYKT